MALTETKTVGSPAMRNTIFLVDDDDEILLECKEFLDLQGFRTDTCNDPEEAVRIITARLDISLVVTDFHMSKLNGSDLIREIRAEITDDRALKFIILTGDLTGNIGNFVEIVPILFKPLKPSIFLTAIRDTLAS